MLRPCAGLKVWGLGLEVWTAVTALCELNCLCEWKCLFVSLNTDFPVTLCGRCLWCHSSGQSTELPCCGKMIASTVEWTWEHFVPHSHVTFAHGSHLTCWTCCSQMEVHSFPMTDRLRCRFIAFMRWVYSTIDCVSINQTDFSDMLSLWNYFVNESKIPWKFMLAQCNH